MYLQKAGAWATIGSFFIGCLALYLMWRSQHPTSPTRSFAVHSVGSVGPAGWVFLFGLVGAGALNFAAVTIQSRSLKKPDRLTKRPTSQATTDTSSKTPTANPQVRIWVSPDTTPTYLQNLRDGRTTREAEKLEQDFIGKWMKLSGVVFDVHEYGADSHITRVEVQQQGLIWPVSLEFDEKWHGHVVVLRVGERIHAAGQIESVNRLGLRLQNCELVQS